MPWEFKRWVYQPDKAVRTSLYPVIRQGSRVWQVRWADRETKVIQKQWFADRDEAEVFKICIGRGMTLDQAHQALWQLTEESHEGR